MRDGDSVRSGRRGNALVLVMMFGLLLGFSALSVDIGLLRLADTQLQSAVDSAVMSAANQLDGTAAGIVAARARGVSVLAMNKVLDTTLVTTTSAFEVGTYDATTGVFTPYTGANAKAVNAVRLTHTPPQVGSALGAAAFGVAGYAIDARAMSVRPMRAGRARTSKCFLPFAVPDCWVSSTPPGTNPPPLKFTFSPSPTDAIAYATLSSPASSTSIQAQMNNHCTNGELQVSTPDQSYYVYPNNGAILPALNTVADILNGITAVPTQTWDTTMYGPMPSPRNGGADTANIPWPVSAVTNPRWTYTWEGPIALVDAGANCSSITFNAQPLEVTGIAWGVVYDVRTAPPAAGRNIYMQLDLINEHDVWGDVDEDATGNVFAYGESSMTAW